MPNFLRAAWALFLVSTLFLVSALLPNPISAADESVKLQEWQKKYEQFETDYAAALEKLALWCDENQLSDEAEVTRKKKERPDAADRLFVAILPPNVQISDEMQEAALAKTKKKNADSERSPHEEWNFRFCRLRIQASNMLVKMARRAMSDRCTALAFELLMRALEENPDHPEARKILGFERVDDLWLSPFEKQQMHTDIYSSKFGWIPQKNLKRYENGERFYKGRWISEAEDAAIHADIENGWVVETPHFTVVTNHSLAAAAHIGEEVEVLYRVWKQLFLRYFATDAQLQALFDGKSASASSKNRSEGLGTGTNRKHRIVFFKNQNNYNAYLSPRYPQVTQSCGMYIIEDRASYFFAGEKFDRATLLHEVTHQLFSELRRTSPNVGKQENFWMIEAIAVHMESLHDEGRCHVVGGFNTPRMLAARYRFVKNGFYIPLKELSSYNMKEFQSHSEMTKLYSECAGLMQFFLHANHGVYRDAAADILRDIYTGNASLRTIPDHVGRSFDDLDDEYRDFISKNQEELNAWEMD